jgi:hypothetical protein
MSIYAGRGYGARALLVSDISPTVEDGRNAMQNAIANV